MLTKKHFLIKSATAAGMATSVLLGLAGLTLNPAPASAIVIASTLHIRPAALPEQASC